VKTNFETPYSDPILRVREVERLSSLSRATIYRGMASGRFPPAIRLSERRVGWRQAEVIAWKQDPTGWFHRTDLVPVGAATKRGAPFPG
jgi:prophage regulatory protein